MKFYILQRLLFVVFILGVCGCAHTNEANPNNTHANDFALSPDGKRIVFSLSKGNKHYDLALYEIAAGTIKPFKMTGSEYYIQPVFSPNGKEIAFVAGKRLRGGNIYILNCDTGNVRQITYTECAYPEGIGKFNTNKLPNFSPDGKKIIFCRSGFVHGSVGASGLMTRDWDIFEVEISSGAERKLTNQKFFTIMRPYYLPDGKRFVFSASILTNESGVGPKDFREYAKLYKENDIFIMDGEPNELKPAFVYGDSSTQPSVSGNGDVVFVSRTNYIGDLFVYNTKSIERLTKERYPSGRYGPFIALDGSRVLFKTDKKRDKGNIGWTVWIINRDGTGLREIDFLDLLNNKN